MSGNTDRTERNIGEECQYQKIHKTHTYLGLIRNGRPRDIKPRYSGDRLSLHCSSIHTKCIIDYIYGLNDCENRKLLNAIINGFVNLYSPVPAIINPPDESVL